jgi:MarR family transcriptional regulator, transcriptional regulator for hemolysin
VIAAEIDALATRVRAEIMQGVSDEDAAATLKVIRMMAANLQTVVKG